MYSCWLWCLRKCLVKACGVLGYCLILCFPDCVGYGLDVLVAFGCGLLGLAVVWVLFYLLGWFFGYWIFGFIGFAFVFDDAVIFVNSVGYCDTVYRCGVLGCLFVSLRFD